MNTKLLRQKVLDLAIHGKLLDKAVVEALETTPGYEPASKLLERIRGESDVLFSDISKSETKLVSEATLPLATAGKPSSASPSPRGKAPKTPSAPISEDEIPFEIPENWCWCRLSDYLDVRDGTHDSPKYFEEGIPFVTSKNLRNGEIDFSDCKLISFEDHKKYSARSFVEDGDILFAMIGSIGNPVIVKKDRDFSIKNVALFKRYSKELTNEKFIYFYLYYAQEIMKKNTTGGLQPFMSLSMLRDWYLPLPPLEEQKLIVEEIERIFALIDTVEQNKTDLETVIKQTKSKILDLAIHGKLVPQDKTDEPASKMLEKLRAEKEEKIAKGQLKRDKNDSYIYKSNDGKWKERKADGTEEEIEVPFEIPESWSWCHASDLYNIRSAIRIHKSDWKDKGIPFFRGRDLVELAKTGDVHPEVFITEELYELNKSKGGIPQKDDILVSAVGTLGCVHIVEGTKKFYYKDAYILCFENIHNLNSEYIKYVIESDYTHNVIYDGSKGTTIDQLTIENAKALWIPFPPLEEQKRIVKNIEEILNMIEIIMI